MTRKAVLSIVVASFGCIQSASAAVALSDLIANNDTVVSGDLVFSQFSFSGLGGINNSANINVDAISGAEPGIQFSGGFSDVPGGGGAGFTINYVVSLVGGGLIDSTTLSGNPAAILSGVGRVTSTFGGQSLEVFDNADTGVTDLLSSVDLTTPVSELAVQVDFLAEAGAVGGVTGSFVDQTFRGKGGDGVVPEMSSLGTWVTLMMGAVAFCLFNHYRKPEMVEAKS